MVTVHQIVYIGVLFIFAYFPIVRAVFSEVTYQNFDKLTDGRIFLVLLFYSDDCEECPKALKAFEKAGNNFRDYNEVVFGSVRTDTDRILALRYSIDSTPSVVFFPYKKKPSPYLGEIDPKLLTEAVTAARLEGNLFRRVHMNEHLLGQHFTDVHKDESPAREISIHEYKTDVLDNDGYVLLALYNDGCKEQCLVFDMVARVFRDDDNISLLKMHVRDAEEVTEQYQILSNPTLIWFRPEDRRMGKIYGGELTFHMLVAFINSITGAERDFDGRIHENAGRIDEIDAFLKENMMYLISSRNMDHIIINLMLLVKKLEAPKRFVDYYVKIVERTRNGMTIDQILEKENDYITKRLSARKLSNKERDEWTKFRNIVSGIVDMAAEKLMSERSSDPAKMAEEMMYQHERTAKLVPSPPPSDGMQRAEWVSHHHDEL